MPPTLLDSRKFKALLLAVILLGLPVVCVGVSLATGHATFEQFTELTKWAFASLAAVVAVFMGAIAHEDAAVKGRPSPITAGGDVTVTTTTTTPPTGGGDTPIRSVPSPPAVPTDMTAGGRMLALLCLLGAVLFGMEETGCTPGDRQTARTVLDVEQTACIIANATLDVPAIQMICRLTDTLDPEFRKLLAAGRKVAATKGAPVCHAAGAP